MVGNDAHWRLVFTSPTGNERYEIYGCEDVLRAALDEFEASKNAVDGTSQYKKAIRIESITNTCDRSPQTTVIEVEKFAVVYMHRYA